MLRRLPLVLVLLAFSPRSGIAQTCLGDCNENGVVAVNELIIGVRIALGEAELSSCAAFDNGSSVVTVNVLIAAVRNAVNGCGAPTPTNTVAQAATPTAAAAEIFQGALVRTNGRFTYQATIGIDGADAECNTLFPGTHACTLADLRAAAAVGELRGAMDTGGTAVESFWAIDPSRDDRDQCHTNVPWDYATAHTGHFADLVTLNNASGELSALQEDRICAAQSWVGCCR